MRATLSLLAVMLDSGCSKSSPGTDDTRAPVDRGPRATIKIGGASVSDVGGGEVEAALQKQQWSPAGASRSVTGPMETLTVSADHGPLHATVSIVRPRTTPGPTGGRAASARDQRAYLGPSAAMTLDEPVLVTVTIKDHKDEARQLLDGLIER
jgi:hypothetical protein